MDPVSLQAHRIPAHALIVSADSEPFRAMFFGNFEKPDEVEIPDTDVESFKAFLRRLPRHF